MKLESGIFAGGWNAKDYHELPDQFHCNAKDRLKMQADNSDNSKKNDKSITATGISANYNNVENFPQISD